MGIISALLVLEKVEEQTVRLVAQQKLVEKYVHVNPFCCLLYGISAAVHA